MMTLISRRSWSRVEAVKDQTQLLCTIRAAHTSFSTASHRNTLQDQLADKDLGFSSDEALLKQYNQLTLHHKKILHRTDSADLDRLIRSLLVYICHTERDQLLGQYSSAPLFLHIHPKFINK